MIRDTTSVRINPMALVAHQLQRRVGAELGSQAGAFPQVS